MMTIIAYPRGLIIAYPNYLLSSTWLQMMRPCVPIRGTFGNPPHLEMTSLVSPSFLYHMIQLAEREAIFGTMTDCYKQKVIVEAHESSSIFLRGVHNIEKFHLFSHASYGRYDRNLRARMSLGCWLGRFPQMIHEIVYIREQNNSMYQQC